VDELKYMLLLRPLNGERVLYVIVSELYGYLVQRCWCYLCFDAFLGVTLFDMSLSISVYLYMD